MPALLLVPSSTCAGPDDGDCFVIFSSSQLSPEKAKMVHPRILGRRSPTEGRDTMQTPPALFVDSSERRILLELQGFKLPHHWGLRQSGAIPLRASIA
jgi:hypothetical protein